MGDHSNSNPVSLVITIFFATLAWLAKDIEFTIKILASVVAITAGCFSAYSSYLNIKEKKLNKLKTKNNETDSTVSPGDPTTAKT